MDIPSRVRVAGAFENAAGRGKMVGSRPAPIPARIRDRCMYRLIAPHISENELYLRLFITNGGGW